MLLRYFYDEKLAHASYLVGCQQRGEAFVVDPMRNIEPYIEVAEKEGMKITGVLETHIHADFVSGSRELASHFDLTMYVSDEGDENWKYENLEDIKHRLLKDGDQFELGMLTFEVMHTPGHTPESISFLLTDGAAADEPIGIFTGDFVFAGDVGRPDLLEKAAGVEGTAKAGAKQMYESIERFKQLDDYLQVWPAHGAGSACGKALGAVPSTTVGYEKRFSWAMQFDNKANFIEELLDGQPEPPYYFAVMKSVNKVGVELLNNLPELKEVTKLAEIEGLIQEGNQVIDTRDPVSYAEGHVAGTFNIPFNKAFTNWIGWIIEYEKPLYLLVDEDADLDEMMTALHSIGIDKVLGYANAADIIAQSSNLNSYESLTPTEAKILIDAGDVAIVDVRNLTEYEAGNINGQHIMVGRLKNHLDEFPKDHKTIVHCQSGLRSAIAMSVLKANGIHNIVNMTGGYNRWVNDIK